MSNFILTVRKNFDSTKSYKFNLNSSISVLAIEHSNSIILVCRKQYEIEKKKSHTDLSIVCWNLCVGIFKKPTSDHCYCTTLTLKKLIIYYGNNNKYCLFF